MPIVAILFLTAVNNLKYFDRYIVQAVEPTITAEFALTNTEAGYLVSAFVLGYFIFSPIFGFFGDRFDGQACAVPLSTLTRLEEIKRASLETSGGHTVIQYRDQIMPLIDMSMALGGCSIVSSDDEPTTQVLVYGSEGRAIGLMVHRISDIVHEELKIISSSTRPGIAYTAVVQGRVTEIIDVCQLIQNYAPAFMGNMCSLTSRDLPVVPDVNDYLEQLLPAEAVQ
jgi:two-component system chemotaxis sensor kinase CheA